MTGSIGHCMWIVKTYLVDDILTKVDRMSMAVSLETRPPLLDHKVVEFVATLPPRFKLKGFESKHILKRAAGRLLPQEILSRKKQGFRLPIAEWLRSQLRGTAEDLLLGPRATQRGYFKKTEVETLWRDHLSGHRDNAHQVWSLILLELWHRKYIDDSRPPVAPEVSHVQSLIMPGQWRLAGTLSRVASLGNVMVASTSSSTVLTSFGVESTNGGKLRQWSRGIDLLEVHSPPPQSLSQRLVCSASPPSAISTQRAPILVTATLL